MFAHPSNMLMRIHGLRGLVRYAVVACSGCGQAWNVEQRHERVSCPRCRKNVELERRARLWQGDSATEARGAAASIRAALAQKIPVEIANQRIREARESAVARHDSPLDAAAAKGRTVRNLSARADEVAAWLTRLLGPTEHAQFVEALVKAGIPAERAEKEVVRMLSTDVIYEPRAGSYSSLSE